MATPLRSLLTGLVDYAGLFPPAELAMAQAVEKYASYRKGAHTWMLGRFVLPVPRLEEFAKSGFLNIAGGCCGPPPEHIAHLLASLMTLQ